MIASNGISLDQDTEERFADLLSKYGNEAVEIAEKVFRVIKKTG